MKLESLKFVIWYLVVDDSLSFISFYVKTYLFFNDSLTYVMNYNYLYIIYLFLFTKSRILRFTIQIYDSIYETLPTIQGRISILTTMVTSIGQGRRWGRWSWALDSLNSNNFLIENTRYMYICTIIFPLI